jgi:hypothetical protein
MNDLGALYRGNRLLQAFVLSLGALSLIVLPTLAADNPQPKPRVALDASRFSYPMKQGYEAAQKYPELLSKLFCYCGCDRSHAHQSLFDCYVTTHGAYCGICMEEAIEARLLKDKGESLQSIQKQIDDHFAKYYPGPADPSPTLKKYRESLKNAGLKLHDLPKQVAVFPGGKDHGNCCASHTKQVK